MALFRQSEIKDRSLWENFLSRHPEANFLQSWYWGDFQFSLNKTVHRIGIYDKTKLIGVSLSVVEKAKRATYLTIAAGPIIPWDKSGVVKFWMDNLINLAESNGCSFIRIRPQLIDNDFSRNIFKTLGFVNSPMHLEAQLTREIDISKSETEILNNMRKNTRYEINKAIKLGTTVRSSKNPADIAAFYKLQLDTAKRQQFVPFSLDYLKNQFEAFVKNDQALLYSAHLKNKLLAQAFIIFYGSEAVYHYGASTLDGRIYPGSYLIQWNALREAKSLGLKRYNLWGVAPEGDPAHRFYSLSTFKRGFGGVDVAYLPAQDLIVDKLKYLPNIIVESLRKRARRL